MAATDGQHFSIECSDDENYDNKDTNYRVVNGKRVWEPSGADISRLYGQLEAKGFIELRWQCPGRRSPSVHNLGLNSKTDSTDAGMATDVKSDLMNEFDFDGDFNGDQPVLSKANAPPKRRTTGLKKQTNLTKVMADIKKYQFVDQTKKLTLHTTPNIIANINTMSSNMTSNITTAAIVVTTLPAATITTPITTAPSAPILVTALPTPTAPAPSTPTTSAPSPAVTPLQMTAVESLPTITTTITEPPVVSSPMVTMSITPITSTNTPTTVQSLFSFRSDSPTDIL